MLFPSSIFDPKHRDNDGTVSPLITVFVCAHCCHLRPSREVPPLWGFPKYSPCAPTFPWPWCSRSLLQRHRAHRPLLCSLITTYSTFRPEDFDVICFSFGKIQKENTDWELVCLWYKSYRLLLSSLCLTDIVDSYRSGLELKFYY